MVNLAYFALARQDQISVSLADYFMAFRRVHFFNTDGKNHFHCQFADFGMKLFDFTILSLGLLTSYENR